jgi:hypothetical protein
MNQQTFELDEPVVVHFPKYSFNGKIVGVNPGKKGAEGTTYIVMSSTGAYSCFYSLSKNMQYLFKA